MKRRGGGTGGSVGRALAAMAASSDGFCVTSSNNAMVSAGTTTWNFATITVALLGPFSPQ